MLMLSIFLILNSRPAFALEATNPKAMCARMIHDSQKAECAKMAQNLKLDWYAATACNALTDDKKFLNCWQNVSDAQFNPEALGRCVENPDDNDDVVLKCILSLKGNRVPASVKPYQDMKIRNSNR